MSQICSKNKNVGKKENELESVWNHEQGLGIYLYSLFKNSLVSIAAVWSKHVQNK